MQNCSLARNLAVAVKKIPPVFPQVLERDDRMPRADGFSGMTSGSEFFGVYTGNVAEVLIYTVITFAACYLIVAGGIQSGIEKFNKVGIPALFAILVILFLFYLISAIRNRGKPKPERHGTGNLGGLGGYSGRGVGVGGPPNSSPGAFALYGRKNDGADEDKEDPRKK